MKRWGAAQLKEDGGHRRPRRAHWRAQTAFLAVALSLASAPHGGAQQVGDCHITHATTSVWSDINEAGAVVYYGHALMFTEGCGLSPAEIRATFAPTAGTTTTCDFRGTLRQDEAVCTGGRGAALSGTPMVITASGHSEGSGGLDRFESSCTLIVPSRGRAACPLPVS